MDEEKKNKAIRISKYLFELLKIKQKTVKELQYLINKVSLEIKDLNPPSQSTLYKWKNKYIINNNISFDIFKGNKFRSSRLHEDVEEIIKNSINEAYLTTCKISIRHLQRIINRKIYEENCNNCKSLKEPAYETIRNYINLLDKKTVVSKREGLIEALKQYKTFRQGINATRILEYVEIDHVFLNININYEDVILGKPVLTLLIDNYSLSILGIYIGFGKPNTNCVLNSLKSALLPKNSINEVIDKFNSKWIQFGTIENLITDNAKEFKSNDFKNICLELGINFQYAPPYHPWYKRYVENHFGVLEKKIISNMPGSYNNNKLTDAIPYNVFIKIIYTFIVDIYHNSYNRRKKGTPYNLWKLSEKNNPICISLPYDQINIIMGPTLERVISKTGISIDNIYYNDESLNFIRRNNILGSKVKVKRNWDDVSYIYVYCSFSNKYIKVCAVDQEYSKNKTIFQHECVMKVAIKESKNLDDKEKIYSAERKINQYLDDIMKPIKKPKRKDKILYYMNISETTFNKNKEKSFDNDKLIFNYDNIQEVDEDSDDNDEWDVFNRD
ncbi:Integrase core domain protein [compost metagenome]